MDQYNVLGVSARALGHRARALGLRWIAALRSRQHVFRYSGAALALLIAGASYATTYYSYDSLGRVTQAVESDGTTTQYTYDADGNVLSITRTAASSVLVIGSVSSAGGAVGSSITINGSGFSSIPSQNTVTINGVAAQVTYASGNRLVVTIPSGATTGDIEIATQNGSVTSTAPFTVVPVSVSSFSPSSAIAGASITLNGGGFDTTATNNTVLINGVAATVTSATTTQLQITVPSGATPGHISVTSPLGSAITAGDLFVPAPGYSMVQIPAVAVLVPAGDGHVFTMSGNQVAVALFDGTAGQRMSLVATNQGTYGRYTVFAPDGSTLASDVINLNSTGAAAALPPLPTSGTYAWYFTPSSTPSAITFKLQTDVVGGLPINGTPTATSLAPGQSATYTFAGTAGQSFSMTLSPFTGTTSVNATLYSPDGSLLVNCGTFQASYGGNPPPQCDFTVPATGTYTLRIVPAFNSPSTASFNTFVVQDFSATLTAGTPGPTVSLNLGPHQHGLLNFTAMANQTLALYFGPASINPNGLLQFTLNGPGNTFVTRNSVTNGGSLTFNLTNLAAGNYSALIAPYSTGTTASLQTALATGVTATLPTSGTNSQFQTYVPGQSAYFTFAAIAGQSLGLALTQLAITPSTVGSASISVYKPDASYYTSGTCYVGTTPGCQMSLRNLPLTGNYQIVVTPSGQASMTLGMTLSQDQTGTLTLGAASPITLTSTGQNAVFTFTTDGSQPLILTGTAIVTSPANTPVTVYVYDANNNLAPYTSMTQSGVLNLGILPAGTYTVLVAPNNAATASLQLALQPGVGGH